MPMKTFEEFKTSREKMDPSTRKMSQRQWEQAYDAYRRSRERVRGSSQSESKKRSSSASGSGSGSRSTSGSSASRGLHAPSTLSKTAQLRAHVRQESAYAELRTIINVLAWVAVALSILIGFGSLMSTVATGAGFVLLGGMFMQILFVLVLKMVIHVLIDIPDVALYRAVKEQEHMETQTSVPSEPAA